jgi:hypothetical protein
MDDNVTVAEPTEHFVLPLEGERLGAEDENAFDGLPGLHLPN